MVRMNRVIQSLYHRQLRYTVAVKNIHPPSFSIFQREGHTLGSIEIVFLKVRDILYQMP